MPSNLNQWRQLLRDLGFTDSEASIYLLSLEMGPSPVQELARRADVSRVTTYTVIESLMKEGLMSTVQKGKKTLYAAESPDRLVSYMHTRIRGLESTLRDVETSVEQLKLLQRGEKPVVKLFEGPEALKAIQDDILQTKPKEIHEFGNYDEIRAIYSREDLAPFKQKLAGLRSKVKAVYGSATMKPTAVGTDSAVRHLANTDFKGDVLVYNDKIAVSTFSGKQISVLIESAEIARTLRALIDEAAKR